MAYSAIGITTRHVYWCIIIDLMLSKEHCYPESVTLKAKQCLNLRAKSNFLMGSDLSSGNDLAIKAEILKYHMCFEVCLRLVHRTRGVRTLHRFFLFLKRADSENSASFPSPNSEMLRNTLKSLPIQIHQEKQKSPKVIYH